MPVASIWNSAAGTHRRRMIAEVLIPGVAGIEGSAPDSEVFRTLAGVFGDVRRHLLGGDSPGAAPPGLPVGSPRGMDGSE
jgi:hypothetical protein